MAKRFDRCGFNFVPLVSEVFGHVACALDILLLSRDQPGNVVRNGGDIDNRLKVLFDALRMVEDCRELTGQVPSEDEKPFFCLLKDDKLITGFRVSADRLLVPPADGEYESDVHLILKVKTMVLHDTDSLVSPLF